MSRESLYSDQGLRKKCVFGDSLKEHLYLVYTPAYDPDANRIEWLWRISRRVVTHNHHRRTFDLLLVDLESIFSHVF